MYQLLVSLSFSLYQSTISNQKFIISVTTVLTDTREVTFRCGCGVTDGLVSSKKLTRQTSMVKLVITDKKGPRLNEIPRVVSNLLVRGGTVS